ncbi:MAG: hypothetical protein MZV64_10085 [Ignavibacteriales bacterium]|nr:hypothetical protein [Ignavibacteriales bacterium]
MRGFHKLTFWERQEVDMLHKRDANENWRFIEELAVLAEVDAKNLKLREDYRPGQVNKIVAQTFGREICDLIAKIYGYPWGPREESGVSWPVVVDLTQVVLNSDSVTERNLRYVYENR